MSKLKEAAVNFEQTERHLRAVLSLLETVRATGSLQTAAEEAEITLTQRRDEIAKAEDLHAKRSKEADDTLTSAKAEAKAIVDKANDNAGKIVANAENRAEEIMTDAAERQAAALEHAKAAKAERAEHEAARDKAIEELKDVELRLERARTKAAEILKAGA